MTIADSISYWVLKSVSHADTSYKSNDGYKDEIDVKYVYDNSVSNFKQINSGDIAVIVDKKQVLGLAKISRIVIYNGTKERRRCPVCRSTNYEDRKTKLPRYRCNKGHEFVKLETETVEVINYEAYYSKSFIVPTQVITVDKLRPYFHNGYNRNMSMQSLTKEFFVKYYKNELDTLNQTFSYPSGEDSENYFRDYFENNYAPNDKDERPAIMRSIMQRRGQKKFRDALRDYYGDKCMITGCEILDVIEAAHINPYRGEKDHHVANGLLLRADIHILFDLDLLGIEPNSLKIYLSKSILEDGYEKLQGVRLDVNENKEGPSKNALELRWKQFQLAKL